MDIPFIPRNTQISWQKMVDLMRSLLGFDLVVVAQLSSQGCNIVVAGLSENYDFRIIGELHPDSSFVCNGAISDSDPFFFQDIPVKNLLPFYNNEYGERGVITGVALSSGGHRSWGLLYAVSFHSLEFSDRQNSLVKMFKHIFEADFSLLERERALALNRQQLQESERRYSSLANDACIGIAVVNDGRITFSNRYIAKFLGYSESELWGHSFFDLIVEEEAEELRRIMGERAEKVLTPFPSQVSFITKEGVIRYMLFQCSMVAASERVLFQIYLVDMTDRVEALLALKESESRYRSLYTLIALGMSSSGGSQKELRDSELKFRSVFDLAPVGMALLDSSGSPWLCNPMLEGMLGYSREELCSGAYKNATFKDDVQATENASRDVLSGRRRVVFLHKRFVRDDGGIVWVKASFSAIPGLVGESSNILVILEDITNQRNMQRRIAQSHKLEAVGQLAGGIAHDFNNLLHVIVGYAELLQETLDKEQRSDLDVILDASNRGVGLVQQLLAFSRSESMKLSRLDINDLVDRTLKMLRRVIGEDIDLKVETDSGLAPVFGDSNQLTQVLMNLCVNSRDAMPGGGMLSISTEAVTLPHSDPDLELPAGNYAVITVSDSGVGMSPDVMERAFEPFFTTKDVGVGTGLGLATVYGVVSRHSGAVCLESKVGAGTTFRIYLPVTVRGDEDTVPVNEDYSVCSGNNELILIAEDDEHVAKLAYDVLKRNGYRVIVTHNGEEAIAALEAGRKEISALVLDLIMPRKSGISVYERAVEIGCDLPVLFCTGHGEEKHPTVESENALFLKKPYASVDLLQKLHALLSNGSGGESAPD